MLCMCVQHGKETRPTGKTRAVCNSISFPPLSGFLGIGIGESVDWHVFIADRRVGCMLKPEPGHKRGPHAPHKQYIDTVCIYFIDILTVTKSLISSTLFRLIEQNLQYHLSNLVSGSVKGWTMFYYRLFGSYTSSWQNNTWLNTMCLIDLFH